MVRKGPRRGRDPQSQGEQRKGNACRGCKAGPPPQHCLTFWTRSFCGHYPVPCRVLSSMPWLHPLDAVSTPTAAPTPRSRQLQGSPDFVKCPLRGQITPDQKHCYCGKVQRHSEISVYNPRAPPQETVSFRIY